MFSSNIELLKVWKQTDRKTWSHPDTPTPPSACSSTVHVVSVTVFGKVSVWTYNIVPFIVIFAEFSFKIEKPKQ